MVEEEEEEEEEGGGGGKKQLLSTQQEEGGGGGGGEGRRLLPLSSLLNLTGKNFLLYAHGAGPYPTMHDAAGSFSITWGGEASEQEELPPPPKVPTYLPLTHPPTHPPTYPCVYISATLT